MNPNLAIDIFCFVLFYLDCTALCQAADVHVFVQRRDFKWAQSLHPLKSVQQNEHFQPCLGYMGYLTC